MADARQTETPTRFDAITERQSVIAELVRTNGFAGIDELAERFQVTTQTIRRDVNHLCDLGMMRRVHGGVQLMSSGNLPFRLRQVLRLETKRRIASAMANVIPQGATVALSIGTTLEAVAEALAHKRTRIFTNNLHVAMSAHDADGTTVVIPGGTLRPGDGDIVGNHTVEFFERFKVDFGIFGVAAVDPDGGLLDFHEDEVAARQAILANCREAYLVLDHTKFDRQAHVRGGHITDVSHVVCDATPPPPITAKLAEAGVGLILCQEGDA